MHTSTRLCAADFHYGRQDALGRHEIDFAAFCPDYHHQDRVGVVSLALEQGVLETSFALLALTTAFYDRLRASHTDFFDYPQHFAFVGEAGGLAGGVETPQLRVGDSALLVNTPELWEAWSWLDVWPDAKWVSAPATTAGMVQRIFDFQINRLFWPRALKPLTVSDPLPDYLWKMLKTSVKSVYLYGDGDPAWAGVRGECIEIRGEAAVQALVQESIARLPATLLMDSAIDAGMASPRAQLFERVDARAFFDTMALLSVKR